MRIYAESKCLVGTVPRKVLAINRQDRPPYKASPEYQASLADRLSESSRRTRIGLSAQSPKFLPHEVKIVDCDSIGEGLILDISQSVDDTVAQVRRKSPGARADANHALKLLDLSRLQTFLKNAHPLRIGSANDDWCWNGRCRVAKNHRRTRGERRLRDILFSLLRRGFLNAHCRRYINDTSGQRPRVVIVFHVGQSCP